MLKYAVASALIVVPCFWHDRIAAGDLASHAYNGWLAELIQQGKVQGLHISWQFTNIAFDLLLSWLGSMAGLAVAQRVAVAISALLFFWSAFCLASVIARKQQPWFVTPLLAVLTYGTVFNLGLFNFYIGTALALGALALLWKLKWQRTAVAVAVLALSWLAQIFPAMFAIGAFVYLRIARSISRRARLVLWMGCAVLLLVMGYFMVSRWDGLWNPRQVLHATGADQSYMFGKHYRVTTLAMLTSWALMLWRLARQQGWARTLTRIPLQLYALCIVGAALLPSAILFPWYTAWFGGIPERIGLIGAVILISYLARVEPTWWIRAAAVAVAVLYFPMLYLDTRAINVMEDKVDAVIAQLSAGSHVIANDLYYPPATGFDESMMVDRACIGRCFSFGNYEPSTLQFRVRATPGNSIVAWTEGKPIVQQFFHAQPSGTLYRIYGCGNDLRDVCMQPLKADDRQLLVRDPHRPVKSSLPAP